MHIQNQVNTTVFLLSITVKLDQPRTKKNATACKSRTKKETGKNDKNEYPALEQQRVQLKWEPSQVLLIKLLSKKKYSHRDLNRWDRLLPPFDQN